MEILEKYKVYLDGTDKKDGTKSSYLLDVRKLLQRFTEYELSAITETDIEKYCDELMETRKASTVERTIASARMFWTYLIEQGVCTDNPAQNVRPKAAAPVPLPEETARLITAASGRDTMKELRDKCIVALLNRTVIKQTELIEINIDNVDIEKKQIRLSDGRVVKIDKATAKELREYLTFLETVFMPLENPLFMNRDGGRLSRQGVWSITKQNR